MSVNDKLLDTIELLVNNSVSKAGYDKTIQAQILSCQDQTTGKYKCRYQDSIIYAYNTDSETSYPKGSYVYILVPENNMSKEKTILGTTKKLGLNYITQAIGDQAYNKIGKNCVNLSKSVYLNTNNKQYKRKIYEKGKTNSLITIDSDIQNYIKKSSSLIAGATFKTSIPVDKQTRGHYGITYNLKFKNNGNGNTIVRSFTIDQDKMVDNPYKLLRPTRQYQIFNIDGLNFIQIDSIEIFNSNFPNAAGTTTEGQLSTGDIEISALEFYGAERLSDQELNSVALTILTPQGTVFQAAAASTSYKTLIAQVKIKGKVSTSNNLSFYWGVENVGIGPSSQYYNKNLGKGWKCLNNKNIIQSETETEDAIIEWIPGNSTFSVKRSDIIAKQVKYKVAVVYQDTVIFKQITIQNLLNSAPKITIQSDNGIYFYYDIGHPTLTCKVNNVQISNFTYSWAYENSAGNLEILQETAATNEEYANTISTLTQLNNDIKKGTKFKEKQSSTLATLNDAVQRFNHIQRVDKNKIYNVQVDNIIDFGTFKCSVYNANGVYQGTASIKLLNSLKNENQHSLVINNGSVSYQYDENGVSPTSSSLDNPQAIQALTFTVYDNLGNAIDNDVIKSTGKIKWYFPIENTLLIDNGNGSNYIIDQTGTYRCYQGKDTLLYKINNKFDLSKTLNQIKLNVSFKDINITTTTHFTFVKQGMSGTNGTDYVVKLVPNTTMADAPEFPMITKAGSKVFVNYGINTSLAETEITTNVGYNLLKAQLWRGGELVWQGITSPTNHTIDNQTTIPAEITWSILQNNYGDGVKDLSNFAITKQGKISYTGDSLQTSHSSPRANIIKCSIRMTSTATGQNKMYYGTLPMTVAWAVNQNYRVGLKEHTGFRSVIYTADGLLPKYNGSEIFDFTCKEKINNTWCDVTLVSGEHSISYNRGRCGNYRSNISPHGIINSIELFSPVENNEKHPDLLQKNQVILKPASRYNGICVNTGIYCVYTQGQQVIGKLQATIHFLLNRFGLSHLNDWDGNSIQINDDGGFILSPQMGAGAKDSNNSFTGVLMGEVKEAGKNTSKIGLMGLSEGQQSFFLNSKNGAALFGKSGRGQIAIDPKTNNALLYSGSFWKNFDEDGLPTSYTKANENKQGMLIDLSTPEIRYGNGKFSLNASGQAHIGGGDAAGWVIGSATLKSSNGAVVLDSVNDYIHLLNSTGKIYSGAHNTLSQTNEGFYLSHDGLSIGKYFLVNATNDTLKIKADENALNSTFGNWKVVKDTDNKIKLSSNRGGIYLDAESSSISLGSEEGQIYSGSHIELENASEGFYISGQGLSIGSKFYVDNTGTMRIGSGAVKEISNHHYWTISSTSGGGSYISYGGDQQFIYAGQIDTSQQNKVYIGTGGISLGNKFSVSSSGNVIAQKGTIAGWNITQHYLSKTASTEPPVTLMINDGLYNSTTTGNTYPKIYTGAHPSLKTPADGFYLSYDGLSIGSKFKVSSKGVITLGQNAVEQSSTGGAYYWTIDGTSGRSYIKYNTDASTYTAAKGDENPNHALRVYIGTDGIVLGNNFAVSNTGMITASSGYIGGWAIGANTLSSGGIRLNATDGTISASGITLSGASGSTTLDPSTVQAPSGSTVSDRGFSSGIGKYLQDHFTYLYADKGDFGELEAKVGNIDDLTSKFIKTDDLLVNGKIKADYISASSIASAFSTITQINVGGSIIMGSEAGISFGSSGTLNSRNPSWRHFQSVSELIANGLYFLTAHD